MAGLNKVLLIGNLVRDPELRHAPNGTSICSFTVATTRSWKTKDGEKAEETEFNRVTAFGPTGENCHKHLAKGKQVYIEGRLKTRTWDEDGTKRYATDIICEVVQFLGERPKK